MRVLVFIITSIFYVSKLPAQILINDYNRPIGQIYGGINSPFRIGNLMGLQVGSKWHYGLSPLCSGIEGVACYGYKKYTWPSVGNYAYSEKYARLSAYLGIVFLRKYRLNIAYHLKLNCVIYESKLKTENAQIKNLFPDKTSWTHYSVGSSYIASYQLTKPIAAYLDFSILRPYYGKYRIFYGIGLSYKITSKYNIKNE